MEYDIGVNKRTEIFMLVYICSEAEADKSKSVNSPWSLQNYTTLYMISCKEHQKAASQTSFFFIPNRFGTPVVQYELGDFCCSLGVRLITFTSYELSMVLCISEKRKFLPCAD